MNELERLIADAGMPGPSDHLDHRIRALLAGASGGSPSRWRNIVVLCGTAACVGVIGFFLGRQSVRVAPVDRAPTIAASVREADANVTRVALGEDQLASFFVWRPAREGMLGSGPVTLEVSQSH